MSCGLCIHETLKFFKTGIRINCIYPRAVCVVLGQVFLQVFLFFAVIIIPPMLYTHISFIYHWHYMFLTIYLQLC
jgi:hypothetical protein